MKMQDPSKSRQQRSQHSQDTTHTSLRLTVIASKVITKVSDTVAADHDHTIAQSCLPHQVTSGICTKAAVFSHNQVTHVKSRSQSPSSGPQYTAAVQAGAWQRTGIKHTTCCSRKCPVSTVPANCAQWTAETGHCWQQQDGHPTPQQDGWRLAAPHKHLHCTVPGIS